MIDRVTIPFPTSTSVAIRRRPTVDSADILGTVTLWVVFAIMLLSTIVFTLMAYRVPVQKRLFYILTIFITTFSSICYFTIASGNGASLLYVPDRSPGGFSHIYREVYWAHYVDWSLTTPLLLLELAFLAGLSGANILVIVVADLIMSLLCLLAAFGHSGGQKWGYYAIACISYFVVVFQLVIPGQRAVAARDPETAKLFVSMSRFTLILWALYLIVLGIGDGSGTISVEAVIICYAILDILTKPVFGFWLLFTDTKNWPNLEGWWVYGLATEGAVRLDDDN